MPDLKKSPLHALPYEELMAKLRALTNLDVLESPASPTGYKPRSTLFPVEGTCRSGEVARTRTPRGNEG